MEKTIQIVSYISAICGADPAGQFLGCRCLWRNNSLWFWFQYFMCIWSTGGKNFSFSIDFPGHHYNSNVTAFTVQPVITSATSCKLPVFSRWGNVFDKLATCIYGCNQFAWWAAKTPHVVKIEVSDFLLFSDIRPLFIFLVEFLSF